MGKLVRTVRGRMIDMVLDIRKGSPPTGRSCLRHAGNWEEDYSEWIWVPPDLRTETRSLKTPSSNTSAPGNTAPATSRYLAHRRRPRLVALRPELASLFQEIAHSTELMTDKDRNGFSLASWTADPRSENFLYDELS
jgi:hypothetical protein